MGTITPLARLTGVPPPRSSHAFYSHYGIAMFCTREFLQFSDLWELSSGGILQDELAPREQWLFFADVLGTVVYPNERALMIAPALPAKIFKEARVATLSKETTSKVRNAFNGDAGKMICRMRELITHG